jgi:glycogen phosphorylase
VLGWWATVGMEASGTGNMKLALNGALTIGTLDGANIEIRDHVGAENIFIFGLRAEEIEERRRAASQGNSMIAASPRLTGAIKAIEIGVFSPDDADRFTTLMNALRNSDYYMVTADFDAYFATQRSVERLAVDVRLDARKHVQHCTNGVVLLRSDDRRVRPRHLEGTV